MKKNNSEIFIAKARAAHGGKYDYSLVEYVSSRKKVKIICPIHGVFEQLPGGHASDKKKEGCPCCARERTIASRRDNKESFTSKAKEKHGDKYDYSKVVYSGFGDRVEIICKDHGSFWQVPSAHVQGHGCPKCASTATTRRLTKNKEDIITEFKATHGDKYDYSLVEYTHGDKKVKIVCPDHGVFEQTPHDHKCGRGCQKCGAIKKRNALADTHEDFITKATNVHGDEYDYSEAVYKKSNEKVKIICKTHGPFWQIPGCHINESQGCPSCGRGKSKQEDEIFNFISSLGYMPSASRRDLMGNRQEVDIYVPEKNLAIEYDGLLWHGEGFSGKDKDYHLNKTAILAEKGIRLIHIFEDEWVYKKEIVLSRIKNILVDLPKIHARKCEIREISPKVKNEFLEKTHIQGSDRAATSLGAFHGEDLVAVMTFCKARVALGRKGAKNEGVMELSRFSTIPDFRVVGIAGKLLAFYERKYKPTEIISYADKRWSEGGVYKALRFEMVHESRPNYWYIKPSGSKETRRGMRRFHRFNFARHRLEKFFNKSFPKELTEWQIMQSEGWDRIWDCGNILFSKKYN